MELGGGNRTYLLTYLDIYQAAPSCILSATLIGTHSGVLPLFPTLATACKLDSYYL